MVKIEKEYAFDGPNGKRSLRELFDGRRQLIVYHFMFDPTWEKGCPGCTGLVDALGDLSLLNKRDTTFAVVSRAPLAKLDAYTALEGWSIAWFSSFGTDFNYDFHVTLDPKVAVAEYNYRNKAEMVAAKGRVSSNLRSRLRCAPGRDARSAAAAGPCDLRRTLLRRAAPEDAYEWQMTFQLRTW